MYHLVTDDDYHWYLIKEDEDEQFEKFIYEDDDTIDFSDRRINSPSNIFFTEYEKR